MEGGKPKKRLSIVSAYIVCLFVALMPIKVRITFIFIINFIYNHILATTRLIVMVLARGFTHVLIFLAYYLVLGPTAIAVRLMGRDYLSLNKPDGSMFTDKEPADKTEERFERQF
jgi:hypothetical protein